MLRYAFKNPHLTGEEFKHEFTPANFRKQQVSLFIGFNCTFLIPVVMAFYFPIISYVLYIGALVFGLLIYLLRMNHKNIC